MEPTDEVTDVMKKRVFFLNAVLLTASALLLRTMNISYRVYLTSKIGAEGMGLYQLVFSVFVLAITLSTSGISLAVTRLVSEAIADHQPQMIRSGVRKCLLFQHLSQPVRYGRYVFLCELDRSFHPW